ncbi:MAG: sensor histidine kinase [Gaiellaceae bacterium]
MRLVVALLLAPLAAMVAAALALELLAHDLPGQALSPLVLALMLGALGAVIYVQRPEVRIGQLLAINGIGFAVGSLAAAALDYGSVHPIPRLAAQAAFATVWASAALIPCWALFIVWFPDGGFPSRGWLRFFATGSTLCGVLAVAGWLAGPADKTLGFYGSTSSPANAGGPYAGALPWLVTAFPLLLLFPLLAIGSLVGRYRRSSGVVRQQVRWLLVAMPVQVLAQIVSSTLFAQAGAPHAVGAVISVVGQPVPVLAATVAILRYRLWDIDVVVSRALVYGVLWATLSALLLVPAVAAGLLVGGRSALAAVVIALLVTAVFQPARRRLERLAERLVYRHRKAPHVLLTGFWETLRTTDLERLGPLVAHAVHSGLAVEWAGAWMYVASGAGGSLRPLGSSGAPERPPVFVSKTAAAQLRSSPGLVLAEAPAAELVPLWPGEPAAVVPLVAGEELVGLLACGPRRGDALAAADFELLELLGREAGLRLRNLRLESQLRDRLALIEAQADELRRSRQRLVTAQDEERRRIERDLHDGVQQQLVSLAVRLHRLAHETGDRSNGLLGDLAAEAEQAVFALQELARGIFPTVLADQGLTAALRTQAARMPLSVRVDADDAVAGLRLDPELEAAFYFVALEALTNTQKHAAGAAVHVQLGRTDGHVELEVTDEGPGLDGRGHSGSGLQNMADRIAAVGGRLVVEPASGGGTRVRAAVPVAAPAQVPTADSRR